MRNSNSDHQYSWGSKFADRHPVMANIVIIFIIASLGIYAAYLATALFTKHGRSMQVPSVENMTYTQAIQKLHEYGFRAEIRDSMYREDLRPGYVFEQFPKAKSIVKPGRKIFLYINTVQPKQVVLDDDNHPEEMAMRGLSERQALAKLEELGFKKDRIKVVKVLGATDRVIKVSANDRPVHKMQKVPITARLLLEVSDGRLAELQDSLTNLEYLDSYRESQASGGYYDSGSEYTPDPATPSYPEEKPQRRSEPEEEDEGNSQYF